MKNNFLYRLVVASSLSIASIGANAEDKRICTQPLGIDPVTQTYQAIKIACGNMASVLDMNPGYKPEATLRDKKTGGQFTQINDKDRNPIFGVYVPPKAKLKQKKV